MIRQRYMTEFAALDYEELQLVADHARSDGNLAMLYRAHLAARRFANIKGATGIDVSDVTFPDQANNCRRSANARRSSRRTNSSSGKPAAE